METIAVGFWGGYFGTVALMLAGSVFAYVRGLRRVATNAAISAVASALFVLAYLRWLLPRLQDAIHGAAIFTARSISRLSTAIRIPLLFLQTRWQLFKQRKKKPPPSQQE